MKKHIFSLFCTCLILPMRLFAAEGEAADEGQLDRAANIYSVQIDANKSTAGEWGTEELAALIEKLSSAAVPEQEAQAQRGEDYDSVILTYMDGTKDRYFFFEDGQRWYMEIPGEAVYQNAEFITEYISYADSSPGITINIPSFTKSLLSFAVEQDSFGFSYAFALQVLMMEEAGRDEEEALTAARDQFMSAEYAYRYNLLMGLEVSDGEYSALWDEQNELLRRSGRYDELLEICHEVGINLDDEHDEGWELSRASANKDKLYKIKYREFCDGEDQVGGTEYWYFGEYWDAFFREEVYPTIVGENFSDFEEKLNEAEEFYFAYQSREVTDGE